MSAASAVLATRDTRPPTASHASVNCAIAASTPLRHRCEGECAWMRHGRPRRLQLLPQRGWKQVAGHGRPWRRAPRGERLGGHGREVPIPRPAGERPGQAFEASAARTSATRAAPRPTRTGTAVAGSRRSGTRVTPGRPIAACARLPRRGRAARAASWGCRSAPGTLPCRPRTGCSPAADRPTARGRMRLACTRRRPAPDRRCRTRGRRSPGTPGRRSGRRRSGCSRGSPRARCGACSSGRCPRARRAPRTGRRDRRRAAGR